MIAAPPLSSSSSDEDFLLDDEKNSSTESNASPMVPQVLFTGIFITIDSWARAYRERTLLNVGSAAYNTYAQIHNTYHAIEGMPIFEQGIGCAIIAVWLFTGAITIGMLGGATYLIYYVFNSHAELRYFVAQCVGLWPHLG